MMDDIMIKSLTNYVDLKEATIWMMKRFKISFDQVDLEFGIPK
jgi:hypothetical protein